MSRVRTTLTTTDALDVLAELRTLATDLDGIARDFDHTADGAAGPMATDARMAVVSRLVHVHLATHDLALAINRAWPGAVGPLASASFEEAA